MNCQHCGATLAHRAGATSVSEYGTVNHHYRCPAAHCPVDGGMVVTSDGEVTRRVGPATDPNYELRTATDRSGTRPMTDGGTAADGIKRPPKIHDVVPLPDSERGRECALWTGGGPSPCGNEATYLFVYEQSLNPDDESRGNCICCEKHKPRSVDTEGGR
jgi:hypothetical protein